MKLYVLVLAVCLLVASQQASCAHIKARISGTNPVPNHAGINGGDVITIRGCGFHTYSSVSCLFDKRWSSFSGTIVSDKEIRCEAPVIPLTEFNSCVPHRAQLDLVFDGAEDSFVLGVTPNFVLGPVIESLSPNIGFVQGGNTVTIRGFHFDALGVVNVTFDRHRICSNAQVNADGTQITCIVPRGDFDHDAVVDVTFNGNRKCVAHSPFTYHYGPRFTTIFPPCTAVAGGTTVTLTGENLNDPSIQTTALPAANPRVELVFGNVRANATNVVFNGTAVVFRTAAIPGVDTFAQNVRVDVFFKATAGKVTVGPALRYGPMVYTVVTNGPGFQNPVPATGHRGGGDRITIFGCGFSTFGKNQLSPVIQLASQAELCFRSSGPGSVGDSLQIITNGDLSRDRLECITNPIDCTGSSNATLNRNVQVVFRPGQRAPFLTSYNLPSVPLSYAPGPIVHSISPVNGFHLGGDLITIRGENFFSTRTAAGWGVSVSLIFRDTTPQTPPVNFTVGPTPVLPVNVTVVTAPNTLFPGLMNITTDGILVSDNTIIFRTFNNTNFGLATSVSLTFRDLRTAAPLCSDIPRLNQPTFTYGPICTQISPASGFLSGNQRITLHGNGFLSITNTSLTDVRVCLRRINNGTDCTAFQQVSRAPGAFDVVSDTEIHFTTPDLRAGVATPVGGNRLFGDVADIFVYFNGVNTTNPRAHCGTFRFGPTVRSLTPDRGPMGPRARGAAGQPITITGDNFNDLEYGNNVRVDIGTIGTNNAVNFNGDIHASTIWGGVARSEQPVYVTFDTCNTTVSTLDVTWGPVITRVTGPDLLVPQGPVNGSSDLWGLFPHGGDIIVIQGEGFEQYLVNGRFEARCVFDGHPSTNTTLVPLPAGRFAIACTTPPRPPNTDASIAVEFGRACGNANHEIDWRNTVVATQRAHYRPRIDRFFPTFGLTSGSQTVTLFGEGFRDLYYCVFGHYTDGIAVQARIAAGVPLGTQVICRTPPERGEFNTDVVVSLQPVLFHNQTGSISAVVKADEKVWAPTRYHYGPVCTDIVPNVGVIGGGTTATLIGSGFQDCGFSNSFPFRNCTFVSMRVHFVDPITGVRVFTPGPFNETAVNSITLQAPNTANSYLITTPQAPYCGFRPRVIIEYLNVVVMDRMNRFVECKNPNRDYFYHYGPLVTGQFSEFQRNNISYGWEGTTVTITGVNLNDPASGSDVTCFFGTTSADATSVTESQVVCTAPAQKLDRLVEITLDYTGGDQNCIAVDAGLFHYGPVLDAISPTRTNVITQPIVTISGFAFGCCGITQVFCEFPDQRVPAAAAINGTSASAVTCLPPPNRNVDQEIKYIALTFFGAFGEHTVRVTEDNRILSLYYGPIITSVSPSRISRLSGIGEAVTFTGVGFADPYFNGTFCDFLAANGGPDSSTTPTSVTDTQIICPVALYSHRCAAVDNVRPRWSRNCGFFCSRREELGTTYHKTNPHPPRPVDPTRLPFFDDGGGFGDQTFRVEYGPTITSASTTAGAGPAFSPTQTLTSWTTGGLQIAVNFDHLGDWVSDALTNDFGSEQALCVYGDRVAATLTPIRIVGAQHFVNCTVPPGPFNHRGRLQVILDPRRDALTTFPVTTTGTDFWHWTPHAEALSRRWGFSTGYEIVTVSGGGFCQYRSVVCHFGGSIFDNIEGIEGDIINDHTVMCVTPPSSPSVVQVRLEFCSLLDTCDCLHRGAIDTAIVGESFRDTANRKRQVERLSDGQFTFVGVSSIEPTEGPSCGGTDVTVRGTGFNFLENPQCIIGGASVPAIPNGDNALVCVTPDVHRDSDARLLPTERVTCNDFVVSGIFANGAGIHHIVAPNKFEFGTPEVFTIRPTSADINRQTTVYVGGKYFNGNFIGEYLCQFGDLTPVRGVLTLGDPDPADDDDTIQEIIACPTPTVATFPELTIGVVNLEIKFDCEQTSFTSDRIPFRFTKSSPTIRGIFPDHGFEIGGTVLTVFGSRFEGGTRYFCAFGDVDDDDDETQLASATLDFDSLEEPVLKCLVPAKVVPFSQRVDVSISVDGGSTFVKSPRGFLYDDVPTDCPSSGATTTYPAFTSMVAGLLAVVLMVWMM